MMQEFFERVDNDNLFWTILGLLAVFMCLMMLLAERSQGKREREWRRKKMLEEEEDRNEFRKMRIKF